MLYIAIIYMALHLSLIVGWAEKSVNDTSWERIPISEFGLAKGV